MKIHYKDIKKGMLIKVYGVTVHVAEVYPEGDYWHGFIGYYNNDCCFDYMLIGSMEVEVIR